MGVTQAGGVSSARRADCSRNCMAARYGPGPWLMRATPSRASSACDGSVGIIITLTGSSVAAQIARM